MTERLDFHFSLSRVGEGNGNPLQCSCLENPRDRGAQWAAICGVTQSRTQLKRLGNSSRRINYMYKNSSGVLLGNKLNILQYFVYSGLPVSFIRVFQFSACEISCMFSQIYLKVLFIVHLLSHVQLQLFLTSWTAGYQTSLSFTISWAFLKFMFIESTVSSNHLILCRPQFFSASGSFPMNQLFTTGSQRIRASASASVLPMNIEC